MEVFESTPKRWGNSLGITIPKEIVKKERISPNRKVRILVVGRQESLREVFGSLKLKKPTQQVMQEIDKGYD